MEVDVTFVENIAKGKEIDDEKRGPRTEPWGTPEVTEEGRDVKFCKLNELSATIEI